MSSGKHASKSGISPASTYWVITLVGALVYELVNLAMGHKGGALSHVVWWAAGDMYSWRWVAVLAPICGLLTWCVPHFLAQWGTGVHLLIFVAVWAFLLGLATLTH